MNHIVQFDVVPRLKNLTPLYLLDEWLSYTHFQKSEYSSSISPIQFLGGYAWLVSTTLRRVVSPTTNSCSIIEDRTLLMKTHKVLIVLQH